MRRRNAEHLPSHSWLAFNRLRDYMAYAFLAVFIIVFIAVWTITYTIRRDCTDVYNRDLKLFGYWMHVEIGSAKTECPQNDN